MMPSASVPLAAGKGQPAAGLAMPQAARELLLVALAPGLLQAAWERLLVALVLALQRAASVRLPAA